MITIPTADLVGILSDVIPFALDDDEVPLLNQVRLEWDGRQLHALATDRYRLGISSWEPGDIGDGEESQDELGVDWGSGDDPWAMAVDLPDAKELVKVFKLPTKEAIGVPVTVDYDTERWQARVSRSKDTGHSGLTVLVQDRRDEFPNVRALLDKPAAATDRIGYTAKMRWPTSPRCARAARCSCPSLALPVSPA